MNTPEKYVTAYIVESLTGIKGTNQERVYEVLKGSDFQIDDPFLNLVYSIAKYNPEDSRVKDVVASLVMGHTLLVNKKIADAFEQTIKEEVERRLEEEKDKPMLKYSVSGDTAYFLAKVKSKSGQFVVSTLFVPASLAEYTIEEFRKRFPGAVVNEIKR